MKRDEYGQESLWNSFFLKRHPLTFFLPRGPVGNTTL
jgi:hypothetical protein